MNGSNLAKVSLLTMLIAGLNPCTHNMIYAAEEVSQEEKKKQLNEQLFKAVEAEDVNKIRTLVFEGADVNAQAIPSLFTPMHLAAKRGYMEVVRTLHDLGADINAKDGQWGATPLSYAIQHPLSEIQLLCELGADPTIPDKNGTSPLSEAKGMIEKYGPERYDYLKNMASLQIRVLEHLKDRIKNRTITKAELDRLPDNLKGQLSIPADLP